MATSRIIEASLSVNVLTSKGRGISENSTSSPHVNTQILSSRLGRHASLVSSPTRQLNSLKKYFHGAAIQSSNDGTVTQLQLTVVCAEPEAAGQTLDASTTPRDEGPSYKKILLPIVDRNPYLGEGTRQAAAMATSLAKMFNSEITVVVIDENERDQIAEHDLRLKNIQWHLSEGGFEEFAMLERLGEGKMPAAVVGEIADDLDLDLVVLSMEAVHSKHIDANLLAEFVPCPIFLVPL